MKATKAEHRFYFETFIRCTLHTCSRGFRFRWLIDPTSLKSARGPPRKGHFSPEGADPHLNQTVKFKKSAKKIQRKGINMGLRVIAGLM